MAARTTSKIKGNKAKGRQSSKKKGYYERQVMKTANNKARRSRKRQKKVEYWREQKLLAAPNPS